MISLLQPGLCVHSITAERFFEFVSGRSFTSVSVKRSYVDSKFYATVVGTVYGEYNGLEIFHVECEDQLKRDWVITKAKALLVPGGPPAATVGDTVTFRPIEFE